MIFAPDWLNFPFLFTRSTSISQWQLKAPKHAQDAGCAPDWLRRICHSGPFYIFWDCVVIANILIVSTMRFDEGKGDRQLKDKLR